MAFVDLEEIENGTAFQDEWYISINKSNLFSWNRADYYDPKPHGVSNKLSDDIRALVKRK